MQYWKRIKETDFVANWIVLFGKFGIVCVINNIVSLAVYYLVVFFDENLYLLGNALGFFVSTLCAYLLNSHFVFGSGQNRSGTRALVKTYVTYTISLCMSTAILYTLVQGMGISERIAPVFSLMVTIPFNFLMNKLWIYRSSEKNSKE